MISIKDKISAIKFRKKILQNLRVVPNRIRIKTKGTDRAEVGGRGAEGTKSLACGGRRNRAAGQKLRKYHEQDQPKDVDTCGGCGGGDCGGGEGGDTGSTASGGVFPYSCFVSSTSLKTISRLRYMNLRKPRKRKKETKVA